ncbi:glycosyltransferase family 2 protein [Crenobacter sp. SG2305]|uniref:glycosyltransferase family 2 protein n=1 Tax=Crenobacter oryzisoli TaxID=3056844 RepID=UPI0025AB1DDD|nr:glycosyltransferase family 2 protein [Crenobacter sp. SG2305]MDN0084255.1 glycosyltransferase family 2 protein [Crenobacter sp. SG2305]
MIKISLITVVYNNKRHIADAIISATSQIDVNLEYIVVDGASTDGTIEIIKQYQDKIDVFQSSRDGGIYEALNAGLSLATGDFVGYLHSDDILASTESIKRLFQNSPEDADAVYGDLDFVDRDNINKTVRKWRSCNFMPRLLKWGWMPPHPTLYVRRELMNEIGGFDPRYRICADYDFIIKLFSRPGIKTHYTPEVIVKMRTGGASNNSVSNVLRKFRENQLILKNNGFHGRRVAAMKILSKIPQFFQFG